MPMHDWTRVDAGTYHDFHQTWIAMLKGKLNELLPEGYYAIAELRIPGAASQIFEQAPDWDASLVDHASSLLSGVDHFLNDGRKPKARMVESVSCDLYVLRQNRIAIRAVPGDRLVAVVEIVSPGIRNAPGSLKSFVERCQRLIERGIHLLIIDPFPTDERTPNGIHAWVFEGFHSDPVAVPPEKPLPLIAYRCLDRIRVYMESIAVGDPLPEMPVFVLPSDGFVEVPLEETYAAAWNSTPAPVRREIECRVENHEKATCGRSRSME